MKKIARVISVLLVATLLLSTVAMSASAASYIVDQDDYENGKLSRPVAFTDSYSYLKIYTHRTSGSSVNPTLFMNGAAVPSQYYTVPKGPLVNYNKTLTYRHSTAPFTCNVKFVSDGEGDYSIRLATSLADCGTW